MAFYDSIAKQWHEATGYKGGAFKEQVLNRVLLDKLLAIEQKSILELGAGNGYFLPLVLRRFSGQVPAQIVVTDQSERLLEIAKRYFRISDATYQRLDVGKTFPWADSEFDILIASMLLNEVPERDFRHVLAECYRVLSPEGLVLIAVTHPKFIEGLQERGMLKSTREGALTMPGSGNLRLPVVMRSLEQYRDGMQAAGFEYEEEDVYPTAEVLNRKAGLRNAGKVPIALVYTCKKSG